MVSQTYARVSILLLKELLQMSVASAGGVSELGGALFDEELPLGPGVVLLREYPLEFTKELMFLAWHTLPAFL